MVDTFNSDDALSFALKIIAAMKGLIAILSLLILEAFAIHYGVDGAFFLPVVAAIAGIGGWGLSKLTK